MSIEDKDISCKEEIPKRKKRSLAEIIYEKLKSKPATKEEIEQLKLERERAIIKRDITLIKSQTQTKASRIMDLLTTLSNTPEENRKRNRKIPKL